jgi:hypothetical protein
VLDKQTPTDYKERVYQMSNIYNAKFVSAVRAVLIVACADGSRVTREELSERLAVEGFNVTPEALKVAVAEGAFNTKDQAWFITAGRFGGIRELDLEATAQAFAAAEARQARIDAITQKRMATIAARKAGSVSSASVQASV